jgi:hypothetical protein
LTVVDGAGRVHVSAYGGSDKSRYVAPSAWRLFNAANLHRIDYFPKGHDRVRLDGHVQETRIDGPAAGSNLR